VDWIPLQAVVAGLALPREVVVGSARSQAVAAGLQPLQVVVAGLPRPQAVAVMAPLVLHTPPTATVCS
jgi:hypothetical protein